MPINRVCPDHQEEYGQKVIIPVGDADEKALYDYDQYEDQVLWRKVPESNPVSITIPVSVSFPCNDSCGKF